MNKKLALLSMISIKTDPFVGLNLSCNLYSFNVFMANAGVFCSNDNLSAYSNLELKTAQMNFCLGYIIRKNSKKTIKDNSSLLLEIKHKTKFANVSIVFSLFNKNSISIVISKEFNEIFNVGALVGYSQKEKKEKQKKKSQTSAIEPSFLDLPNHRSTAQLNDDPDSTPLTPDTAPFGNGKSHNPFNDEDVDYESISFHSCRSSEDGENDSVFFDENPSLANASPSTTQIQISQGSTARNQQSQQQYIAKHPATAMHKKLEEARQTAQKNEKLLRKISEPFVQRKNAIIQARQEKVQKMNRLYYLIAQRENTNALTEEKQQEISNEIQKILQELQETTTSELNAQTPIIKPLPIGQINQKEQAAKNKTTSTPSTARARANSMPTRRHASQVPQVNTKTTSKPSTARASSRTTTRRASSTSTRKLAPQHSTIIQVPKVNTATTSTPSTARTSSTSTKRPSPQRSTIIQVPKVNTATTSTPSTARASSTSTRRPASQLSTKREATPINNALISEFLKLQQKTEKQAYDPNLEETPFSSFQPTHRAYFKNFNFNSHFFREVELTLKKILEKLQKKINETSNLDEKKTKEFIKNVKEHLYSQKGLNKLTNLIPTGENATIKKLSEKEGYYRSCLMLIALKEKANTKNDKQRALIKNMIYNLFSLIKSSGSSVKLDVQKAISEINKYIQALAEVEKLQKQINN
ncbi:hypothetical protein [Alphaproteobacteria bacterium endosymbiont of Tiliacea citrago]|uniref:hypothetical protein n=1 Tax=Alphaproteobacteria bacterium endosymbiont of Tiliacea citrago TaxID=3077944 RepID=UPI00313B6DA1